MISFVFKMIKKKICAERRFTARGIITRKKRNF